jgi:hypothetical protein
MLRARGLTASCLLALTTLAAACGSSDKKEPHGLTSAGASGSSGTAGTGGTGGSTGGSGTGGSIALSGGASGSSGSSSGGSGADGLCGGDDFDAVLVPLDLYVMLDSSGSMTDTANGSTKWAAVQGALMSFLEDPASSGIGIGLQFFPLQAADAPATCTSNAECGEFGPCLQKFCQNAGPDFYWCDADAECVTEDGVDYGPCSPLTYCWSQVTALNPTPTLCHFDEDCGMVDDCVRFNECSGNTDYSCKVEGAMCRTATNENLGTCQHFDPLSICAHTTDCHSTSYATPAAEIATLPDAAAALGAVITAKEPEGNTPTAPALEGAIAHARSWALDHPGHKVAVLLATDGLPTECIADPAGDPSGVLGVVDVASAGLAATPSISTFVIGVFSDEDTAAGAGDNLDEIARAGGREAAIIIKTSGDVEQEFLAALDEIRGTRLPCEFQIPASPNGPPQYDQVNVVYTPSPGADQQILYYVPSADDCDDMGGWHYDVDPNTGKPTKIIACPASCELFGSSNEGHVSIRLGCATVVK